MSARYASSFDKALARVCVNCTVCRRARRWQRGAAFWLVKHVEAKLCPFCRAYERVYGRKSHVAAATHQSSPQVRNSANTMNENSRAFVAARRVMGSALGWLLIWLAGPLLALGLQLSLAVVALAVAAIWILFSVFTLYFFRDPTPHVPTAPEAVVAPAHGLVDCVDEAARAVNARLRAVVASVEFTGMTDTPKPRAN